MKVIKRSILIIIILLVLSFNVLALSFLPYKTSLNLNLSRNKVSPNQNFDGFLNISFKELVPSDSKLKFFINNKNDGNSSFSIEWLFRNIKNKDIIPENYKKRGNNVNTDSFTFNSKGSKIKDGIDLTSTTVNNIGEITEFDLTFTGSPFDGSYPTLEVDIGNDNIIDYKYQGNIITNQFDHISSDYIDGDTIDQLKGIRSQQQDTYCEKVFIDKPSKSYKISTKVKKLISGASLHASLSKDPGITDCESQKCCTLNPSSVMNTISCNINIEINDNDNYYACITVFDGNDNDLSNNYYEIAADSDKTHLAGYYNWNPSTVDYFIFVDAQKYNNKLSSMIKHDFDPIILNNYLSNCGDRCLLIPINISSDTKGQITLSNLNVKYVDAVSGPTSVSSLAQINYVPKSINYSNKDLIINLNDLINFTSPLSTGENNKIYAQINVDYNNYNFPVSSNEFSFDVIEGPKAFISYDTNTQGINEYIYFNANKSKKVRNNNLTEFNWDFGDNNLTSGLSVKHSYSNKGNYVVTLTVVDSQGLIGKDKVIIYIQESSGNVQSDIGDSFSIIKLSKEYFSGLSSQAKETIDILGLNKILSSIESNLTLKNNSIQNIIKSDQSLDQKEVKLKEIRQQVIQLKNSIPTSLSISIATFNSKINSLNDIPSDVASSNKNNLFKYQDSVFIDGEARSVTINYLDHNDNFILIRKKIKSGSGNIFEVIPSSASIKDVITPGSVRVSDNVLKFTKNEYYYTLEGNIGDALKTSTIIVPTELSEDSDINSDKQLVQNIKVSNNISIYWILGVLLLIIMLIVFFGLFFKGGLLNKNKKLFKSKKDYDSLLFFVKNALNKGIKEEKVIEALKKKNWSDQQISAIFADVHKFKKR